MSPSNNDHLVLREKVPRIREGECPGESPCTLLVFSDFLGRFLAVLSRSVLELVLVELDSTWKTIHVTRLF